MTDFFRRLLPLTGLSACVLSFMAWSSPATAQVPFDPFRVQVHVSAEETLKTPLLACLETELRAVRDIELAERDADYVLSLVALPMAPSGYAVSLVVMTVHTERALDAMSERWSLPSAARGRLRDVFTGAGALLDQRVLTGPELPLLCQAIATSLDADILVRERRFRTQPPPGA